MNLFSYDGPIARALHLVGDLVVLHLLWLVCSLPVVTIGASTTALYFACMKRFRTDEGRLTRNFFQAFRSNLRQATVEWLILLAVGALLYVDLQISMAVEGLLGRVMVVSCSIFLIPYGFIALYLFPVQAKFENKIRDNFKNAFLMSFHSFPLTLVLLLLAGTFLVLTLFFQPFMGLMICCGAGLYGYLSAGIFVQVFRRYLPDEMKEDQVRSNPHIDR